MKKPQDKLIEVIVEQAVQLEIARIRNVELTSLVIELASQLEQFSSTGKVDIPDTSLYF